MLTSSASRPASRQRRCPQRLRRASSVFPPVGAVAGSGGLASLGRLQPAPPGRSASRALVRSRIRFARQNAVLSRSRCAVPSARAVLASPHGGAEKQSPRQPRRKSRYKKQRQNCRPSSNVCSATSNRCRLFLSSQASRLKPAIAASCGLGLDADTSTQGMTAVCGADAPPRT